MNYEVVNHIDGNKLNNNFANLGWCTPSHNSKYNFILDPYYNSGERNYNSKITNKDALDIFNLAWENKITNAEIGKMYNINDRHVSNIKYGIAWSHITKYKRGMGLEPFTCTNGPKVIS